MEKNKRKIILYESKWSLAVYMMLRLIVITALVLNALDHRWENVFTCILTLGLFIAPVIMEKRLDITLPSVLEIIVLLFVFSAVILGELRAFYVKIAYWDTMLHTLNGFLFAAVGFGLIDMLSKDPRIKFSLSPIFLAIVAFCFSMTVGVLWEFFEYGVDTVFHTDMQKDTIIHSISSVKLNPAGINEPMIIENITSVTVNGEELGLGGYLDIGIHDTMKDLIVNSLGAMVFSACGYYSAKYKRFDDILTKNLVPRRNGAALQPEGKVSRSFD